MPIPYLLVAEKPAGLLSVPGRTPENQDCLVTRLQRAHPDALTVHRLDQVTSGLMLYALGKDMQAALSGCSNGARSPSATRRWWKARSPPRPARSPCR
jgi:Pseudouridylate synthases, 23S RNA-specific